MNDAEEELGARVLLQSCEQTDRRAGDGTTTTAVLSQAMCNFGVQYINDGGNAIALQRGLKRAADFFARKIEEAAVPIETFEEYKSIASLSANSQKLGQVVAEAVMRVGKDGLVTRDRTQEPFDKLKFDEGMPHESGYIEGLAITDENDEVVLENVRVFVTDQKLEAMEDILQVLEGLLEENVETDSEKKQSLLIIAAGVVDEAQSGLAINMKNDVIKAVAVTAPALAQVRTQYLEDICIFSGAKFITSELGLKPKDAKITDCGHVRKAVVGKDKFVIISDGTRTEQVEERVQHLQLGIERVAEEGKTWEAERLYQRINKLRGAVARIEVGGSSEQEVEDKVLRYEDAVNALQSAVELGIVPGGGSTFIYMLRYADECRALFDDEEERKAVDIIVEAMREPIKKVAENAGEVGEIVARHVQDKEWGYGYNADTKQYENLLESNVCDPAAVVIWTLQNSASVAGSLLSAQVLVSSQEVWEQELNDAEYVVDAKGGIADEAKDYAW